MPGSGPSGAYDTANSAADLAAVRSQLGLISDLRRDGYSLIATNPNNLTGGQTTSTPTDNTYRSRHVATANASKIRLVYGNYTSLVGGILTEGMTAIQVSASLQKNGATATDLTGILEPAFFGGRSEAECSPGGLLVTDPAFFDVGPNEWFYVYSHASNYQAPAPSAPTLTEVLTGGGLVGGNNYSVCVVYVFAGGRESATSAYATQALTAGASTRCITVTSPPSVAGAIGYRAYLSGRNGTNQFFRCGRMAAIGQDLTITNENSPYNIRQVRAGGQRFFPWGVRGAGGNNFAGLNSGEGIGSGDRTFLSDNTDLVTGAASTMYSPLAIIGKINGPTVPTVAIAGDSIDAGGTGDHGFPLSAGGPVPRAVTDQLSPCFVLTTDPLYAYVRVGTGGMKASTFAAALNTVQATRSFLAVTELASNLIWGLGQNDKGDGLASMKATVLRAAAWYVARGIKFLPRTLLPETASSNGWTDVAGQTPNAGTEAVRTGYNDWLRDPSASGFRAQAGGVLVDYIEACRYLEVNASGVPTLNGGRWAVPTQTVYASGVLTGVNNSAEFVNSGAGMTANIWKGYSILFTSGAAMNKTGCILWNNSTTINTSSDVGATPSIGDAYEIRRISTIDGVHPSSSGCILAAQSIQEDLASKLVS